MSPKSQMRTVSEMKLVIEDLRVSGKTIRQFCRDTGEKPWAINYWRRRIRDLNKSASTKRFAEIKVKPATKPSRSRAVNPNNFKVTIGEDIGIVVPRDFDAANLKSLVEALRLC